MRDLRFTVLKKLYIGFLSLIILLGILGGSAIYSMNKINEKSTEITTSWLPGVQAINNINYLTENILSLEYKYLLEPNKKELKKLEAQMTAHFQPLKQHLKNMMLQFFWKKIDKNLRN